MKRWLRGVGALAVLGSVVLGAPVALARWGSFPTSWATLTRPDDGTLLLGALTVVGWLAWLAFVASTAVEVVAVASRSRGRIRLPLLGWLQHVSAGLVLAVVALGPAAPPPGAGPVTVMTARPEPEPAGEPLPDSSTDADTESYLVEAGDDLWSISERMLGAGSHWRDLVAANPALLRDPTAQLAAGSRLRLPAASERAPLRITVERGDTLSGLALEHLGAAGRWPRIAAANHDLIDDPDHIEIGWRLSIPGAASPTHRVVPESHHQDPTPGPAPKPGRVQPTPAHPPGPAPTADASDPPPPAAEAPQEASPAVPLLGVFGSLAAAAIIGVAETRRLLRLRERPVGRRLASPEESAVRLRTVLGTQQRPDRLTALDAALRRIGRHCREEGAALPELERITVTGEEIVLDWVSRPTVTPPPGFAGAGRRWTIDLATPWQGGEDPCPYPAVVSIGSTADGDLVLVDVEQSRVLGVAATEPELGRSTMAAMAVELACAPWSAEAHLVVVGEDSALVQLAGGDRVQVQPSVESALTHVRALVARRRTALGDQPLWKLRVDPDRAEAVAPVILCLLGPAARDLATELDRLLEGVPCGVAAIVATDSTETARWQVGGAVEAPTGRFAGTGDRLVAHSIPEATRAGVAGLFRAADDPTTTAAPWWGGSTPDDGRQNVVALHQRPQPGGDDVDIVRLIAGTGHPQVLLIGPTDLRGAPGPEPSRSRQQLVELCAWLLEHPGSTATAMATALAVAEGTRRSNLSRLRAWLGAAPDGTPYLPDAYSGRVLLHPEVTSDWQRLQLLLSPGIDRVGDNTLVAALDLVRGAPLADAAPGQWHWAEELRTDVSSALRDVGLVLTDRALARGDIDLARWAASRALVVAAEDEQLMCARIRTEHRAGNSADVERLVNQVTRQARVLGVDLLPETVELCQQVIEGRLRARA